MNKRCHPLFTALGCLLLLIGAACTPKQTHVDFSLSGIADYEESGSLSKNSKIFVYENDEAENPELEKKIQSKIATLLNSKGYPVTPVEEADFILFYSYTINPGSGEKKPVYDGRMVLELFDGNAFRQMNTVKSRWVGECSGKGIQAEPDQLVNFLLISAFEHFGENTGKVLVVELKPDDERLKVFQQTP